MSTGAVCGGPFSLSLARRRLGMGIYSPLIGASFGPDWRLFGLREVCVGVSFKVLKNNDKKLNWRQLPLRKAVVITQLTLGKIRLNRRFSGVIHGILRGCRQ